MADKKRTYSGVYNSLKAISDETGVDFGVDNMSEADFKKKYFTGPGNITNLYYKLNKISDETNLDFGQGTSDEWLASFGYKKAGKGYQTTDGRRVGTKKTPAANAPSVYQKAKQQSQKAAPAATQSQPAVNGASDISPYIARQDNYTRPGSLVEQLNQRDAEAEQTITKPLRETAKKVQNRQFTPQRTGTQYVDDNGNVVKDETYEAYPLMPEETKEDLENRQVYEQLTTPYDAEKDINNDLRDIRREEEKLTGRRIAAENSKHPDDKTWWDYFREGFGASAVSGIANMGSGLDAGYAEREMNRTGAYGQERQDIAKQQDALIARKRLAEEAQQMISDAKRDKNGYGVLGGIARAGEKVLETALNPTTWDYGQSDLETQMAVADAVIKADSGLEMTDNERKLLDTWAKNAAINSQFGDQLSGWTKAGMVTGESLPFMLEMATNPASGMGKAATKKIVQYATKKATMRFLKEGVEKFGKEQGEKWAKRKGMEFLRNHTKSLVAKKIAGRAIGDITAATVMASTSGRQRVASDYERRMTGDVNIGLDDNGDVIYNGVRQDTRENPGAALFKALASTSIENWSEMAGEYLGLVNSFFGKALGKAVIGKAGRKALQTTGSIEGVSLNKAQKFIYELAAEKGVGAFSEGLKQFADRTQWHGTIGEYLEEEIGNIANAALVGDMTFDNAKDTGVFNLEQNIDTFCGVALMGGFMSALNTAGYAKHRWNYDVDRVDDANEKLFGADSWVDIKTMIDNSHSDPRELNDALTYLMRGETGKKYSKDEKEAILKYTQAVLEKDGAEMTQYQPRMASSSTEEVNGEGGKKQWQVTSLDVNGDAITQQAFDTEEEAKAYEGELKMQQQQKDYQDFLNMSNKLSFSEASQAVDEFMGTLGLDKNSEEYDDALVDINYTDNELGKRFQQFKTEKMLEKAKNTQAAIAQFEEENGWEPGTVKWLSEQDPMQLDNEALEMADQARTFLEGLAYPPTEVHVEHEQQVGSEAGKEVVEKAVSTEESIDPNNNVGQQIADQWKTAQQARQQMFANDKTGDIQSQVEDMERAGFSPQEILSQLETFGKEQRQVMVDYYNAQARYQSMIDTAAKQIDTAANRSRQRHTFKGTINGQADVQNVQKITDGTNQYYLVSGNVTTDPATGQITGSTSGLIIGMDLDGSFVQLGDADGYSVMPVEQTLDQFEAAERTRLQEEVTTAIDPTGGLSQPATPQQGNAAIQSPSQETGQQVNGAQPAVEAGQEQTGANETAAAPETLQGSPLDRIPKDEGGNPIYEQGAAEDTYDVFTEMTGSEEGAAALAQSELNDANKRLKKLQKEREEQLKGNFKGKTLQEKANEMNETAKAIEDEKGRIKYWNSVLTVPHNRRLEAENNAPAETPTPPQTPETPTEETPTQPKNEVPEWRYDTPEAARQRGYKVIEGHRVDRQEEKEMPKGMEVEVQYSTKDKVKGRMTVSELDDVQGSHLTNGQRNEKHFLNEAQPKAEFGADRQAAAQTNAKEENFRPELMLTFNGTQSAYSGSASQTNRRGEVIQGNGRRNLAEYIYAPGNEAVAKKYKDFLKAHASELGTTAEEIDKMEKPFAHIVLDVTDEEAIRLGQFTAQDLESGGKKIPEISTVTTKLGDRYSTFANIVLKHEDPDASLSERIDNNADEAVKWLNNAGVINNTEAKTLLEDKNACRQFVKDLITDQLFKDAHPDLRTMFYELPKNIQSAIISVVGREVAINNDKSILKDIQDSIRAFHELMTSSPEFANAQGANFEKRYAVVSAAVNDWLRQINMDGTVNSEKFSNFALELAKLFKSLKDQKTLSGRLRDYYDLVSGAPREIGMFDAPASAAPVSKEQAIKQIFGIEYGRQRTVPLAGNNQGSEEGGEGSTGTTEGGESEPEGTGQTNSGRGDTGNGEVTPTTSEGESSETAAESNKEYLASHPLTEEQIMADTEATEDEKLNAIDFLKGEDDSAISRFYYDGIYNRAQKSETKAKPSESDPMAAMEKAAKAFREEQKAKDREDIDNALDEFNKFLDNAKGSNVLDAFMRKGLEGNDKAQANLLDAFTLTNEAQRMFLKDLLRLASKVGYAYLKKGVHDAQAWSKNMTDSIGQKLKEVLGWDDAIIGEFVDEVWNQKYTVDGQRMRMSEHAERLKNNKGADTAVNVNKNENNEPENVVSSQQEAAKPQLEGDSAEFAEQQEKIVKLKEDIGRKLRLAVLTGDNQIKTMQSVKALAKEYGLDNLSTTDLQELVEAEVVDLARTVAQSNEWSDEKKFDYIVNLYKSQPTLSARDNDRINKQQYSTPAPMAFLMGLFTSKGKKVESGLEPSAGNGMLTIGLPKEKMHVNDIDEMRLSNLQKQGFGEVTSQDGLQPFEQKAYDVVVTNPPFGSVTPKVYDGIYEISGLEHQMAINALESMKDDGRAAIIIGGNTEYNTNGTVKGKDRVFLNYLYAHYNVVDVVNMDGKTLYSRQGTGYPVRMILINGRKEFNPQSFAPVQSKARAEQVKTYEELYNRIQDDILRDENKSARVHDTESGESGRVDDTRNVGTSTQTGVRNVRTEGSEGQSEVRPASGSSVQRSDNTTERTDKGEQQTVDSRPNGVGSRTEATQSSGSTASQTEGQRDLFDGGNNAERPATESVESGRSGRGARVDEPHRVLGAEKVPYRQQSKNPYSLQSQMPAEQADVVKKALEELGDVDEFLVRELGYSSVEDMHHGSQSPENHGGLAAEQVDSVAMAIHQMNQGNAFIIGDQTGIGKGRQAAALIRYGVKKGGCPVFITVKKALFSDMYRDLCDIGSPELRPFIWSVDDSQHSGNVTDKDGNVIYQLPSKKEQERVVEYINKNGKLPPEYDYVLTTYDSFKSGMMDYENGQKKARRFPNGKKPSAVHFNGQAKRDALETLASNSFVIMDESHNAGGEGSNVGNYLQYITTKAKGTTFLSATFAKRPGNMPIYSLKTAISKAGVAVGELIDAVKRGGATFQEIMSKALTEAGQMIRRERDMTGVTIDWRGIEDEDIIQKQREQYDQVIGLFNDIINFQRKYVDPIVDRMNDAAAEEQGEVDHTPGTRDMGINNVPFASRTYNMVQQILLSLKAEEAAKRAIEHLKAGRKPVITVANTNEGAADEVAAADGESMAMPDLSVNLKKGLRGTLRITKKDAFGNSVNSEIPFDRLSPQGQARYGEIMDAIDKASTGLSLSPIDVIKNELKKAGYKIGELTGRKAEFVYNEDGTVKRVRRADTDKKKVAADFNNGKLDALILNKSAGTGISLHASTKFKDQKQRIMIVAQAQGDVNDEVQIRGRIDRTGQVLRGMYEYVVSQIPSEQRLLMMLKSKLRSLDANTTSSQKSKFNEMNVQDIINKYGDQIVIQYLSEHPELADKMQNPLKWKGDWQVEPAEALANSAEKVDTDGGTASKVLGRMALLTVKEQEQMLDDIGELYQAEIDRLNEMGENDLEITEMPLKAKTLSKAVWETGIEPGGNNPFADNTYVEKVQMDVLKKPMNGEEVKGSQERLLNSVPLTEPHTEHNWENFKDATLKKVNDWAEQKKKDTTDTITERAEKRAKVEQERYVKGAKKAQEKNGLTDEEIEKNGQIQYKTIYNQEMEKLNSALAAIDSQRQVFEDALETFSTDGVYAIPANIYDLGGITFEPSFGKLIDVKITDNFSPNASTLTFATLDGRRKITVPINGRVKQQNNEKRNLFPVINTLTAQTKNNMFGSNVANTLRMLQQNVDNWDKLTSSAARKEGHIITGNLLKALVSTRDQHVGGKLISYTTDTGEVRQGILMPDNFDPRGLTSKTPISSKKEELRYARDKVESADGDVSIRVTNDWDWRNSGYNTLELIVPKSKKKGEKYFNDDVLLSLMNGQFEGSGKMKAEFPRANLDAVMKRLDEMGVTVTEENKEQSDARITDPIEAIEQAAYAFRNERGFYNRTKDELDEITRRVMDIPKRYGLKGGGITQVINSRAELEQLKGKVSDVAYKLIEKGYNKPGVSGLHVSGAGIVVVFGDKVKDAEDAEMTWWHEHTHNFWHSLPADLKDRYGEICFNILDKYFPDVSKILTSGYWPSSWKNEACSFLVESIVKQYGADAFMNQNFGGNQIFVNFANEFRDYLRNGTRKQEQGHVDHRRSRNEGESPEGFTSGRGHLRGRDNESERSWPEEVDYRTADPIEALERAAEEFRDGQTNNPLNNSAKAIYEDRLNRVETVFSEAYQDAMVSLKTAQNAIAKDKEIPDSQNAYMAENLMHGKNKNEQDLYNLEYRDPLIETINKIMTTTGMNWGDIDRYVYTKSGLERNREFFVRDWLEAERKKAIRKLEDLNSDEQEIFNEKARVIEEMFEDGDIDEAEKNKRLKQALQDSHTEYLNDLEREWQIRKRLWDKISLPSYLESLDEFIRKNIDEDYDPSKHDYSGFRAMYGNEKGKYNEKDIIDELMNTEDAINTNPDGEPSDTVDTLWEQIRKATRYGLERYREAGMRSDEQIDQIEQMFHWYVPMRGFKEDRGEDMYQYFTGKGKTKNYIGGLLKHAKGRGSEANYPISTIFAMTYKAIADCNQNLVNQKLYRLCQSNPNDLIILSDSWAVLNEQTGLWEESSPEIPADASEEDVREATLAWEEQMKQLAKEDKAVKLTGRARFDYVPMDKQKKSEHEIDVRINGKPRKMFVVGNPRMAQALNGQLKFENGKNVFSKWNAAIKNMMSSLFTSYSPTFALRNMARDWTHFAMMLNVREGKGYAKAALNYYRETLPRPYHGKKRGGADKGNKKVGMVELFKKYREGTLDMNKEVERDFKDFMDNGGVTGFVQMQKLEDIQKQMQKLYEQQKEGKPIRLNNKLWDYTLGAIEAVNEGIENNARFATYRASRHYAGRTKARSAYDAKEITVNFNRKGAGGKTAGFKSSHTRKIGTGKASFEYKDVEDAAKLFGVTSQILGEGRIFFNATVQAIATTFKNFQNQDGSLNKKYISKWAAKYALPPFMFGLALPYINQLLVAAFGGDDDDPYANLPEWTRRKNICIYVGNDNFITIPIGQELAAFLTLGDIFAGNTYAQELKPVDKDMTDEMLEVMNTFSPVDISTKITRGGMMEDPISEVTGRTFSVLAPLVAVEQNLGWTGRPVYKEDQFKTDKYVPEYQMVYSGTNPVLVGASQKLHEFGGGNEKARGKEWSEVNPAIVQYLWEQYTGGPGKVFSNTISMGKDLKDAITGNGSDFNIRKVEGLKAFVQQGDDRTQYYRTQAKFFKYQEDAEKFKHDSDISNLEKQAKQDDPAAKLELEKIQGTPDYLRYEIIKEANRSSKKEGKEGLDELRKEIRNTTDRKEKQRKQQVYNILMKEVVDALDKVKEYEDL